jgi:erythronate-4-phosphate dehydrogenase
LKIVADENISYAEEAFSHFGTVELYPGRNITNKLLRDADVLITRSVTMVNEELLKETRVKFVGTATIGWDHIDTAYLQKKNIYFTSAAGCNSDAVTEYVFSALYHIAAKNGLSLPGKKLGIIGAGNIGSRISGIASNLGMQVLLNDPPLFDKTRDPKYIPLQELYQCDIISLHVPLTMSGNYKTYHLFDQRNLSFLNKGVILINTSRGPVIDNAALPGYIIDKEITAVLDVWEHEPEMNKDLLSLAEIATPHIAGYSLEGKINGTAIIYNHLCNFYSYDPGWKYEHQVIPVDPIEVITNGSAEDKINSVIEQVYNIRRDDQDLRKALKMQDSEIPRHFDHLRKIYPLRREFFNFEVKKDPDVSEYLKALRFRSPGSV